MPQLDIDEIVRRVIAELGPASGREPAGLPADLLALDETVISVQLLNDRLAGARHLLVRPGALITPAAQDVLREKNIKVSTSAAGAGKKTAASVLVGMAAAMSGLSGIMASLAASGVAVQAASASTLVPLIDEIVDGVADEARLGVALTDQAAAALCLANRRPGIRAVEAGEGSLLRETIESVGANMLVIRPRGRSCFQLAQIIRDFAGGGPRCCPANLRDRLN